MTTRNTLTVKTNVKASGRTFNHSQSALTVKTHVKASGLKVNHNQSTR